MPVKGINAPDYACNACGHFFKKKGILLAAIKNMLSGKKKDREENIRCPKCGSEDIGLLVY